MFWKPATVVYKKPKCLTGIDFVTNILMKQEWQGSNS